jgi:hypothetical protein
MKTYVPNNCNCLNTEYKNEIPAEYASSIPYVLKEMGSGSLSLKLRLKPPAQ